MEDKAHYGKKDKAVSARRGFYLLPNLLTSAALFSGFYAIIAAFQGNYQRAAIGILIAGIFDGLDGRVARLTKTTSRFGIEYDSLSDLIAFGVAPGLLAYSWGLQGYGRLGWVAAFLYVGTTALRLARFNSLSAYSSDKAYFLGLPCPSAAAMVASSVLVCHHFGLYGPVQNVFVLGMIYILSFLMVSTVRYFSFKEFPWFQRHPFSSMVGVILAIAIIAMEPKVTLFFMVSAYVTSGPALVTIKFFRKPFVRIKQGKEPGNIRSSDHGK